nr:ISNCY family transposase [Conexivisphaera calida]
MIRDEDISSTLREIDEHIRREYLEGRPEEERDWRTSEQREAERIREAMRSLDPLIHEAVSSIRIVDRGPGRPPTLTLEQKVKLLLIKQLVGKSNREFAYMLEIFSLLSGVDVSYKTIERLYSDELVMMALHNLHVLLLRRKGVSESDAAGDGTGYSLTVKRNYESYARELKEKAKENQDRGEGGGGKDGEKNAVDGKEKKPRRAMFAYSFRLMDLGTGMYLAWGSSMKSEKEAFEEAMRMLGEVDVRLRSVRLDRYYSESMYMDYFDEDTKVYVIPKRNATLNGSWRWKETMMDFVRNTMSYLEEYYKRERSEAGFSADKRFFGWGVAQSREDRIKGALSVIGLWHNLFHLAPY